GSSSGAAGTLKANRWRTWFSTSRTSRGFAARQSAPLSNSDRSAAPIPMPSPTPSASAAIWPSPRSGRPRRGCEGAFLELPSAARGQADETGQPRRYRCAAFVDHSLQALEHGVVGLSVDLEILHRAVLHHLADIWVG